MALGNAFLKRSAGVRAKEPGNLHTFLEMRPLSQWVASVVRHAGT